MRKPKVSLVQQFSFKLANSLCDLAKLFIIILNNLIALLKDQWVLGETRVTQSFGKQKNIAVVFFSS